MRSTIRNSLFCAAAAINFAMHSGVARGIPEADGIDRSGTTLEMWVRAPGDYASAGKFARPDAQVLKLSKILAKPRSQRILDAQTKTRRVWRGMPLADVLAPTMERMKLPASVDTALLHFANGMIIPVPREAVELPSAQYPMFLAIAFRDTDGEWSSDFPDIAKPEEDNNFRGDPRPIRFGANRLITSSLWHPDAPSRGLGGFSPWQHVDSLVAIEFVARSGWEQQFAGDQSPSAIEGRKVFLERCHWCHGVRMIGARHGWDMVEPLPLWQKRRPDSLFNHVKYPIADATRRGLMMPTQKDVTSGEMFLLWKWMESVAKTPSPRYER